MGQNGYGKAHSRFNYNKPNHKTDNKISLSKILSGHWLHKNIQPSKCEGTKTARSIIVTGNDAARLKTRTMLDLVARE